MKKSGLLWGCVFLLILFIMGCEEDVGEGKSSVGLSGNTALDLPPGHPGTISGTTILMPPESTPPLIHYANCFAGVPNLNDFGIGSSAGATQTYRGYAILPVNAKLDTNELGAYRIRVEVSDPAVVQIDPANIFGSNRLLGTGDCRLRGCPPGCGSNPKYYPPEEFNPAPGFEKIPDIFGTAAGVTVESSDTTGLAQPATGIVNLCNIRVNIVAPLPAGGVGVTFVVDQFEDTLGNPIASTPLSGRVIENFQIQ